MHENLWRLSDVAVALGFPLMAMSAFSLERSKLFISEPADLRCPVQAPIFSPQKLLRRRCWTLVAASSVTESISKSEVAFENIDRKNGARSPGETLFIKPLNAASLQIALTCSKSMKFTRPCNECRSASLSAVSRLAASSAPSQSRGSLAGDQRGSQTRCGNLPATTPKRARLV